MELISNKDLYCVMRDVLLDLDPKVMKHGERTAYIFYKMLQCSRNTKYTEAELAEYSLLAAFHDIGAFKTDFKQDQLRYESRDSIPHAVYGYLMLQYLTPFKDKSKTVLYHHMDYTHIKVLDLKYGELSSHLNVAERMDLYSNIMGSKFDYRMFHKQVGIKYAPKSMECVYQARLRYDIFNRINSEEYLPEIETLFENLSYSEAEKQQFLAALLHCVSEKFGYTMNDMDICISVSEQLADLMNLNEEEKNELSYASIFKAASTSESILKGRLNEECMDIISGKKECIQTDILNVSDAVTKIVKSAGEINKEIVLEGLKTKVREENLKEEIVNVFLEKLDVILEKVNEKLKDTAFLYRKMDEGYNFTYKQIMKQAGL